MSKDLLLRIQELNRRNHLLTGADQEILGPEAGAADRSDMIGDLEDRLVQAVRDRVDRVLQGFTSQLAALEPDPTPEAPPCQVAREDDLEATQWIRRQSDLHPTDAPTQILRAADPGFPENSTQVVTGSDIDITEFLTVIDGKLDRLEEHLHRDSAPARSFAPDRDDLVRELAERLEAGLSEVRARIDELPASVLAASAIPADATPVVERLDQLESSLYEQLHALYRPPERNEGTHTEQLLERIATLETSLGERLEGALEEIVARVTERLESLECGPQAPVTDGDPQGLEQQLDGITQRLGAEIRQQFRELAETIPLCAESPGGSGEVAAASSVDLDPIHERIDELAAVVQTRTAEVLVRLENLLEGDLATATTGDTRPNADGDAATQALELVKGLRKDLSLLVHTLNNHLEESSQLLESVTAIRAGGDVGASVREMLADLEELKHLPERIAGVLTSTDEAHQEVIRSVVSQQADAIVERLSNLASD